MFAEAIGENIVTQGDYGMSCCASAFLAAMARSLRRLRSAVIDPVAPGSRRGDGGCMKLPRNLNGLDLAEHLVRNWDYRRFPLSEQPYHRQKPNRRLIARISIPAHKPLRTGTLAKITSNSWRVYNVRLK